VTEQRLSEILERTAERLPVGPPPVSAMVEDAGRTRRRRTLTAALAGATAIVAVAVTSVVLSSPYGSSSPQPPVVSPPPVSPPAGMRFVGIGHAAIAVPEKWGTNETRCGTPKRDTVVIDATVIPACGADRPGGVDSVELTTGGRRFDFTADETVVIDGVSADRQATTCADWGASGEVCDGTVFIPSLNVSFRAESSTDAATVDRILEQVRILPGRVGVPGIDSVDLSQQGRAVRKYRATLEVAGLAAEVRTELRRRFPSGWIVKVAPQPGTMVTPGTVVTVTLAR
jgi:hypothetical protein